MRSIAVSYTHLVAVVPGSGFGADGYIRLSYALGEQSLSEGLMRIKEFVESLED